MADQQQMILGPAGTKFPLSFADLLNGTYAMRVSSTGGSLAPVASDVAPVTGVTTNTTGTAVPTGGAALGLIDILAAPPMSGGTVVAFMASTDNITFYPILGFLVSGTGAGATTTSVNGKYIVNLAGWRWVRTDVLSYSAGTISTKITLSPSIGPTLSIQATLSTALSRLLDSIDTAHYSTPVVTTVAVTTGSTAVLSANAARGGLLFSNVGANNIFINLAGGTALTTNTLLIPNGMLSIREGAVPTSAITAIAVTGTTNLSVTEFGQ